MIKLPFGIFLALASLVACVPKPEASRSPVVERDVAAMATSMVGASMLDVDRYTPSATLSGCPGKNEFPAKVVETPKLKSALEQAQNYSNSNGGLAMLVVQDGNLIFENYAEQASVQARTESLSMMKTVTAVMVGIAIERGVINSADESIGNHLVEWKDDPRGQITFRQLLTMSSGLQHYPFGVPGGEIEKLLYSTDINAVALGYPLAGAPGSAFLYNNVNSQLIGVAIDRALRKQGLAGFPAFMHENLWCPLRNGEATLWLDREGGSPHYYSGLQATARDWARLGELIRNQGKAGNRQIVASPWIDQMLKPSETNPAYGLHIWRGAAWQKVRKYDPATPFGVTHSEPYLVPDVYFLDGFGGQRVYIIPSRGLTIVRTGEVSMAYDDPVIVNFILSPLDPKNS